MLLSTPILLQPVQAQSQRNQHFDTAQAMYLANEEIKIFSCGLPYKSLGSGIDADSYWYSLYNLGNLSMMSGMGIHLVHGPVGIMMSEQNKTMFPSPKDFMMSRVQHFMLRAGLKRMPKNMYPTYLPFSGGNPQFTQSINPFDAATLRWDPASFDTTINMAALGQTVMKQILWSEDFFGAHRGQQLGRTELDGFRGGVLTAASLNALMALKDQLAFDGSDFASVDPMSYDPMKGLRYFPHAVTPRLDSSKHGMPPMPMGFEVKDASSYLFDQSSLLWAASEFYYYSDPRVKDSYDRVFGEESAGAIFPDMPHMLAKGMSSVLLKNLMAMHLDAQNRVLVDQARPGQQEKLVSTAGSGMLITALENTIRAFHDEPMLKQMATKLLIAQADFMLNKLQASDGRFYQGYNLISQQPVNQTDFTLEAQGFAIKALTLAHRVTGQESYKSAAWRGYESLKKHFWQSKAEVFKGRDSDQKQTTLSAQSIAVTLGALRELALDTQGNTRQELVDYMTRFFNHSIAREDGNGLQMAEMGETGEMLPQDEKEMAMMSQKMTDLMKLPEKTRMEQMMTMRDSDEDGVPNPMFAGGKFGTAPVSATSITLELN
ncbi:MAG: hypothetical protein CVV27_05155 [Candidatus Melainabacteria bacterium HGW-Melainabacteria-1]|nr:MAG: hypothetical protein CVV27_05155 [Candidatus Melainabacteria bacterium HGW-Melainabacteria-1]